MGLNLIPKAESSQVLQLASSSARHVQQPVKGQIQVKRLRRLQAVLPLLEKLVLVSTNKAPLDELADLLGVAAAQLRLSSSSIRPSSPPVGHAVFHRDLRAAFVVHTWPDIAPPGLGRRDRGASDDTCLRQGALVW